RRYLTEREIERLMEPRYPRPAALPRAQEHPAHGQIHRHGARPVQEFLEGLTMTKPLMLGKHQGSSPTSLVSSISTGRRPFFGLLSAGVTSIASPRALSSTRFASANDQTICRYSSNCLSVSLEIGSSWTCSSRGISIAQTLR